jgi:exopolysaccharide biosynthesis polyprenyl glycosylphosphotransferase
VSTERATAERQSLRGEQTARFRRILPPALDTRQPEPITEGEAAPARSFREGLYRRALAVADALTAGVMVSLILPLTTDGMPRAAPLVVMPLIVFVNKLAGLYDRDELVLKKTTLDEVPALVQVTALATLVLWLGLDAWTGVELDGAAATLLWGSFLLSLVVSRVVGRIVARRLSASERCLVLGESETAAMLRAKLTSAGIDAVVVCSVNANGCDWKAGEGFGDELNRLVAANDIHRVIIAPSSGGAQETSELIRIVMHAGVRVSVLPRMLEVVGSSVEFDHVDGLTMLGVRRFGLSRSSRVLKRGFDLVGASVLLIASAPIMAVIAAIVRLDGAPVLFRQVRVGKDGRSFAMLKFRSMVADAEERKEELRNLNEASGLFKIEDDPRVTRSGRWLRRTSLDELPQLVNVWRGEMSLVGPRPLVIDEDARVQGFDRHRLHLTPGMTGPWQVLGSARIPMDEMVGIDYLYVTNWSLWTDVKILLRTIPYVLSSRGM